MLWDSDDISDLDEMPTSIVGVYTPDGFVVGADGREYDIRNGRTRSENVRKIFSISDTGRVLVYAFSGQNKLRGLRATEENIDVLALTHEAVRELALSPSKSLWDYANALGSEITRALPEHEPDELATVIYIDGYYMARPKRAQITIHHNGEGTPQISCADPRAAKIDGCGSGLILEALQRSSEDTREYHSPVWETRREGIDLNGGIELVKSYIGAQCDDQVRKMDKKWFESIGGIGHLCVLHANGQFEWMYRDTHTKQWQACSTPTGPNVP
jgi:hypothetical protein